MTIHEKASPQSKRFFKGLEERYNIKHDNKYDYSKSIYLNKKTKIIINCLIHKDFLQLPSNHIMGHGCPKCGIENGHKKLKLRWQKGDFIPVYHDRNTYKNRKTTLYYIKINKLYKIGLTMTNVKTRFGRDIKKRNKYRSNKNLEFL